MVVGSGLKRTITVIDNVFIDEYMTVANGEYIKVYLYVMRHVTKDLEVAQIADALNHTEADVKRALAYWEKVGVLVSQVEEPEPPVETKEKRQLYTQDEVNRLGTDEEFTQLLYIAQKYLNKMFTPRECEVFAYLYDGLHMSVELLEYLTEYCAQNNHTSIRYLETVAISWHEKGFQTVEEAKAYATGFTKDSFAVMKAFGLTSRGPADTEKDLMNQWFYQYGFTKEIVIEACNRTMSAIHTPSFQYANKILQQWKANGVKNVQDISELDQKRKPKKKAPTNTNNQFHNFEQRDTNYDSLVLDQVKTWLGES